MTRIVSVQSFHRGSGTSMLAANLSAILAAQGRRVGLIDADFQAPTLQVLFGLKEDEIAGTLNHYIQGKVELNETVYDMTERLESPMTGRLILVPASSRMSDITDLLRHGYDLDFAAESLNRLRDLADLDLVVIDTSAGLTEETLVATALCDVMLLVLRLDTRYYQGSSVMLDLARRLGVGQLYMIVNELSSSFDPAQVRAQIEETYGCEAVTLLPFSNEMLTMTGSGIFALRFPHHPLTVELTRLASAIAS